jgi:hypothetical protein
MNVPEGNESGLVVRPSIPGGEGTFGHLCRALDSPINIKRKTLINKMNGRNGKASPQKNRNLILFKKSPDNPKSL